MEAVKREMGQDDTEGSFDLAKSRQWIEVFARKATAQHLIPEIAAHDEAVSLASGTITNRIYNADVTDLTVLFVHGGGWVIGSIDTHDQVARWIAAQTGARVISVGYSLAPEYPFPRAVEECREVFEKTINSARSARIFVAGDSAGANIAAMAILRLDATQKKRITGFVSIYGAYSPEMNLSSHRLFGDGRFGLSEAQMRWFWNLYAPQLAPSDRDKLTPIVADLSGFPSTLCIGAECDILLDDTLALYSRLAGSAVDVTLSLWPNLPHGCMHFVGVVESVTQAAGTIVQFIDAKGRNTQTTRVEAAAAPKAADGHQGPSLINVEPLFLTSRTRSHGSLAHKIANQIIAGQLAPGELLPNEEKASASFGVSRSAYREAMAAFLLANRIA
jgi:acetyl esterase